MRIRATIATIAVAIVLVPAIIQPSIELLSKSFEGDGAARYAAILTKPGHLIAIWNSVLLSVLTVIAAGLIGVPLAFLTHGTGSGGRWLGKLALAPLFLSPVLGTLAFHFLLDPGGVVRHFLPESDYEFRGLHAVLTVHALTLFVYFFLFTSAALTRIDWDLVAAARSLGATPSRALRTVVLPLLRPALFGAGVLTFMASMASFTAPYAFGGKVPYPTLTTAIFSIANDDLETAFALAVVLAVTSIACAALFQRSAEAAVSSASKGAAQSLAGPGRAARLAKTALAALVVLVTLLPLLTLVLLSFKRGGRIGSEPLAADLTATHYQAIFRCLFSGDPSGFAGKLLPSIGRSLIYAAVATVANVFFAVLLVLGVPDRWRAAKRVAITLSMLPIAIPGTVLALAFLEAFADTGPFGVGPALAGSVAILPFAYFVRNIPIVVQATATAAAQLPEALPEASRTLGAGALRTLARVTLPLMSRGIAAGAIMAFLVATGEFVASYLLWTPRTQPAAVAIFGEYKDQEYGTAAAAGTVLMVVVLLLAWLLTAVTSRRAPRPAGS